MNVSSNVSELNEVHMSKVVVSTSNESVVGCIALTSSDLVLLDTVKFWVEGVALCVVAVFGLLANLLSIFIMCKSDMRTFFSHLLVVLSAMDIGFLSLSILEAFRRSFGVVWSVQTYLFAFVLHPFKAIFMTASIFMTVAISMERHRAVHSPINLRLILICTRKTYGMRLLKYVLPALLGALVLNLPLFFEARISHVPESAVFEEEERNDTKTDVVENNRTVAVIVATELRTNWAYNLYYVNGARLGLTGVLPLILLATLNFKIYREIRKHNRDESSTSRRTSASLVANRRRQEDSMALLFFNIIIVFFTCQLPRLVVNVREVMIIDLVMTCYKHEMSAYETWVRVLVFISHLLLVVNSSVNIFFYICLNRLFKRHFMVIVYCVLNKLNLSDSDERLRWEARGVEGVSDTGLMAHRRLEMARETQRRPPRRSSSERMIETLEMAHMP